MNRYDKDFLKLAIILTTLLIVLIFNLMAFGYGSEDGVNDRNCNYDSIADYTPGYVVGCVVFKKRFKEEGK